MASGWETKDTGFEPRQLQTTFDPGLPKNNKWFPTKNSVPLMNKNLQGVI